MFGAEHLDDPGEALALALGYPYAIPTSSYGLVGGVVADIEAVEGDLAGRAPLLAYGSNAAPEVLARKLAAAPDPVPVVRTDLHDFDVVYSAHVSPYGAVPATLRRSPGTEVRAFIAYLTSEQLGLVSATEPNYELVKLDSPSCVLTQGDVPAELSAYVSRHGCLLLDGHEIALAEIRARHRRFVAMGQREVLQRVRDLLDPGRDLASFVEASAAGAISAARLDRGEAP
ncbi:MAG TPA: hypothetical protein VFT10_09530 [Solirubrobacterales bacterium]|nr:hypothetical protein [Solirubrobacterales bacterium]